MKKIYLLLILLFCFTLQSIAQIAIDPKGTKITVDSSKWKFSGVNIYNKNTGNVGIGNTNPTYKLDVTGKLRVSDSLITNSAQIIALPSGSTSDSIVVADPITGILKRIAASQLNKKDSTTASNGLNLVGKDVELGGSLTTNTTITNNSNTLTLATGGSALNITGLPSGATTDSIMTISAAGLVKRINLSSLSASSVKYTDTAAMLTNYLNDANNGLTKSGKVVKLGGSLTAATTITTTGTNTLSIAGLQSGNATTDSIMTVTASGLIRNITPASLASTSVKYTDTAAMLTNYLNDANNGLTKSGKVVKLGGPLTAATTITTTGTNTLSIAGLQSGNATTDSIMTVTAAGLVRNITPASLSSTSVKYTDTAAMLANYLNDANNGLTKSGKVVKLGGNLTAATTITNNSNTLTFATGGSALNITGLTGGSLTDSLLTISAAGLVKRINMTSLSSFAVKYTDTAAMLAPYMHETDTTGMLANYINDANNGLTKSGKVVKLGGPLNAATTITTTGTNTLSIAGLQSGNATTDSIMTVTAAGLVRNITPASLFSTSVKYTDTAAMLTNYLNDANNGLTKSGKVIKLGGALTGATSITTTGTNTLALSGLQSGSLNDSLVVADATSGVLRRIATGNFTGWSLTGNSGTTPGTNFIGTKDNVDLVFKINNVESGRLNLYNQSASFGYNSLAGYKSTAIGYGATTTTLTEAVAVGNSATATYQSVAVGSGSSTTSSSSVAVGNAATAAYQSTAIGANTSATGNNSTVLGFGATTAQANALILGNSSAKVGIGTSTPAYALDVNATSNPLKLSGVVSGATTDSVLTINSSGVVRNINFNSFTSGSVKYTDTAAMLSNYLNDANNGLTKSGKAIQLGGALTKKDTLTTTATNTLAIAGLQSGSIATDSILTVNGTTNAIARVSINQINPISGLLPATKTNSIDNTTFGQTWVWTGLGTGSGLTLNSNSNTSTNGIFNVANTAASGTGVVAKIQSNNSATFTGVTVLANGNVGIGNAAPASVTSSTNNTPTSASTNTLAVNGTVDAPVYTSPVQAFGSKGAGTFTWDVSLGANASVTLTGNATLAFTNQKKGMYGLIIVTQDATGGRTLTLPTGSKVINGGGGVATLTTTGSASDILTFYYDGTNYWWTIGNNYN